MSNLNSIRDTFFEECAELLEALVEGLANMADGEGDLETVHAVFRAVHSIKGGAGAFGLDQLVAFAHSLETVLDRLRNATMDQTPDVMRILQKAGDVLGDIVQAAHNDTKLTSPLVDATLAELARFENAATTSEAPPQELEFSFQPMAIEIDEIADFDDSVRQLIEDGAPMGFTIKFRPHWGLYQNGHDPVLLFIALSQLGSIDVTLSEDELPKFDDLAEDSAYLSWSIRLLTDESETVLHDVFEFVEGLCSLTITPIYDKTVIEETETDSGPPNPEMAGLSELELAQQGTKKSSGPRPTLRVDLERVDRLINTVGELIINQAMISQRLQKDSVLMDAELSNDLDDYKLLARDIQEAVMAIRAQPVKPLFQRMSRIVRESAEDTHKSAHLEVLGETTEVDKTIIERLADPLTHMVRNAIDHGLETPQERTTLGKDPVGTITLSAAHRSGSVLIEVRDDGAGLNRDKILSIAKQKKLIEQDIELTEAEIDNLLFLPGFSTVDKISNLSGRGVGMDVVKNSVQALGGRITISSKLGEGTKFTIILPLTLAVMEGMVISVAGQTMVVPISAMLETIRPEPKDIHPIGTDRHLLSVRGQYVPIVDVAKMLGLSHTSEYPEPEVFLLIETEGMEQCALGVDKIFDQRQVVIKSLQGNYRSVPGVSAATILGDGKIALILDPDAIALMQAKPPRNFQVSEPNLEFAHERT